MLPYTSLLYVDYFRTLIAEGFLHYSVVLLAEILDGATILDEPEPLAMLRAYPSPRPGGLPIKAALWIGHQLSALAVSALILRRAGPGVLSAILAGPAACGLL